MKYVTIATDISSDAVNEITTWACYIRHSGGVIKEVSQFKQFYKNTALAETYALVNALTIARKQVPNWEENQVIIYNEIEHALSPVKTKAGNIRQRDAERSEAILKIALPILQQAGGWERRKIKAHFSGWRESDNPTKYIINRWCDQECRRFLQEIRRNKSTQNT